MLLVNFLWERIWLKSGNSNILLLLNSLWERIRLKRESSNMLLLLNFLWERIRLKRANFFDSSCQDSSGVKSAIWHLQSCYNYNHVLCYNHALLWGALQKNPILMEISKLLVKNAASLFSKCGKEPWEKSRQSAGIRGVQSMQSICGRRAGQEISNLIERPERFSGLKQFW